MNNSFRPPRARRVALLAAALLCSLAHAANPAAAPGEVQARFDDAKMRSVLGAQYWTLTHCASDVGRKAALLAVLGAEEPRELTLKSAIEKAGGVDPYRKRVTALLKDRNEIVRGFAAVWLGVLGDRRSAPDLLELLRAEGLPVDEPAFAGGDRARAAIGLGLLGAKESAAEIAKLLESPNEHVRGGAAIALGYLKAAQFAPDIAKLLAADEEQLQIAAISSLAEMGAKNRVADIAAALKSDGSGVPEAAAYALAHLGAADRAKDILPLLKQPLNQAAAAEAIALLGAREHAAAIATILDDPKSFSRGTAVLALGILKATEFEDRMVKCLDDPDKGVRGSAAWGLILMGSKREPARVLALAAAAPDVVEIRAVGAAQIAVVERQAAFERAQASFKALTAAAPQK